MPPRYWLSTLINKASAALSQGSQPSIRYQPKMAGVLVAIAAWMRLEAKQEVGIMMSALCQKRMSTERLWQTFHGIFKLWAKTLLKLQRTAFASQYKGAEKKLQILPA